jgi:PAS domain S-box-containing protein
MSQPSEELRASPEDRLRQSEERLRAGMAVASFAIAEVDYATHTVRLSPEAAVLFGLGTGETTVTRAQVHATFHPDERDELERVIAAVLDPAGDGWFAREHRVVWPDGAERWLNVRKQVTFDRAATPARPVSALLVARDVTERKRRELNLRFLADLQAAFTELSTADELLRAVGARIAAHFGVAHCLFVEIDQAAGLAHVVYDHHRPDVPGLEAVYRLPQFHTDAERRQLAAGLSLGIDDVWDDLRPVPAAASFVELGIRALVTAPYVRNGQWKFALSLQHHRPHRWQPEELALAQELAARVYPLLERARAEAALRDSEERFRSVFEAIDEGFCIVEFLFDGAGQAHDYRFLQVNPAFVRMTGLADAVGRTARELLPALDPFWIETYGGVALSGESVRLERPWEVSGRWFDVNALRVGGPESRRVAIVFNDITERKLAEQQIRDANYRFRLAEEAALGFNYDWDLDAGTVTRSESVARVLGYGPDELPHTWAAWAALLHPDDATIGSEAAALALVRGLAEDSVSAEYRVRHKDGRYRWVLERALVIRDEQGRVRRLIGQTTDITERKELEAERERLYAQEQEARAQAEEANRLKDEFLATVSHELRTPLTAFLGYAELLQRRKRDEAYIARTVEKMARAARTQAQLIEDLLDVSRIVSGKLRIDPEPIDLGAVVRAALDTVRPTVEAKQLRLRVDLGAPQHTILGDASRLQQVVWNLLSNAAKFTPAGGEIGVQLESGPAEVTLTVSDTGQGINREFLPFVFDRFRQADSASDRSYGGLGLGLAIVRHLVELHGGAVTAASAGVGQGAVFTVRLPLAAPGTLAGPRPAELGAIPATLRGLRVLVVDDQPDIVGLVDEILSAAGAEVRTCQSARDALDAVRRWRPAVLVSDIAMPREDGYWLIRQVRALPAEEGRDVPAVALTAFVRMEDRLRVLEAGFQSYASKPVEAAELRATVARLAAGGPPV